MQEGFSSWIIADYLESMGIFMKEEIARMDLGN